MPNFPSQTPVFLSTGNPLTENRAQSSAGGYDGQVGQRFSYREPTVGAVQKEFQLVVLDSAVDVAPSEGAVAWWRGNTGYIVTTDVSVAGRGSVAGVFGAVITVDYICCIQVGGPAPVQFQTSPTSPPDDTGKFVIPSATDAKADCLAAGTPASYPPLGVTAGFASAGVATVELNPPRRD